MVIRLDFLPCCFLLGQLGQFIELENQLVRLRYLA